MRVQRRRGDVVVVGLDAVERDLLTSLAAQYDEVLHDDEGDDAVHDRLFPAAYRDDPDADRKSANAGRIAASIAAAGDGRILLDPDAVGAWLPALTDLRLVIAERLGIRRDDDPVPDGQLGQVYRWLAELQARLVDAVDR
jgi:hypothetical protein